MVDDKSVNNSTDQPTISPDNEPGMFKDFRNKPWFSWLVRIVIAAVVILVIVFGGRWLHHHFSKKPQTVPAVTRPLPSSSATDHGAKGTSGGSSSKNTSSGKKSSSSKSSNPNQELVNTGPGDVAAIFLAGSFVAAGLHYVISLRKKS